MNRLEKNAIKCINCDEVIESRQTCEYVTCSCGKVSVDGGLEHRARIFPNEPASLWYLELSEYANGERTED